MQFETVIAARVPRVRHPDGRTAMVAVPWAEARSRWTLMFEAFALRVLETSRSLSRGAELLRLDWSSVQRIMERAVVVEEAHAGHRCRISTSALTPKLWATYFSPAMMRATRLTFQK